MAHTTLIDAPALAALLRDGTPAVLVDVGFDLVDTGAGERAYAQAHLPGAVYLHLDRDLCGAKNGRNGRHPLPERSAFAATLGRIGVAAQTQVVAYDGQGGPYAARLWWMLRWMGHDAVALLDGGLAAWVGSGGTVTADRAQPVAAAPYPERPPHATVVDTQALARRLGMVRLVDARAGERFRGEVEPLDPVAGHIPGATHRFFKDNLAGDGRFKPRERLRQEYAALLGADAPADTVHQCGSGVTACHNLLAMEHAGLDTAALYPGSWSEWSADPGRPVARG